MSTQSLLRVYDPSECDEQGAPLDWERCRTCGGSGTDPDPESGREIWDCRVCDGHGSLKAAALEARVQALAVPYENYQDADGLWGRRRVYRCEDCGHPMNEGTWEGDLFIAPMCASSGYLSFKHPEQATAEDWQPLHCQAAWTWLRQGREPKPYATIAVHFSPCDEGCRHGGPGRLGDDPANIGAIRWRPVNDLSQHSRIDLMHDASWRQVDVRTGQPAPAGHQHPMIFTRPWDLRLENLSVLCLRCWVAR